MVGHKLRNEELEILTCSIIGNFMIFSLLSVFQKSEVAATEKNRATAVAMNAEIRRTKARLVEELPKLQRLALKKVKCIFHLSLFHNLVVVGCV